GRFAARHLDVTWRGLARDAVFFRVQVDRRSRWCGLDAHLLWCCDRDVRARGHQCRDEDRPTHLVNDNARTVECTPSNSWLAAVARLTGLLAGVSLATSRLGLLVHELVGHGGVAIALGGHVTDVTLFWFAGGW